MFNPILYTRIPKDNKVQQEMYYKKTQWFFHNLGISKKGRNNIGKG